jgi:hypothetical protein
MPYICQCLPGALGLNAPQLALPLYLTARADRCSSNHGHQARSYPVHDQQRLHLYASASLPITPEQALMCRLAVEDGSGSLGIGCRWTRPCFGSIFVVGAPVPCIVTLRRRRRSLPWTRFDVRLCAAHCCTCKSPLYISVGTQSTTT